MRHPRGIPAGLVALGFVVLTAAASTLAPALHETFDPSITAGVGDETVIAALERGLPPLHPLILDARVEPGPASDPPQLGHRATVTFSMLGVPGPTRVKLFVDVGAHWGGTPDRGALELALWSLLTPAVIVGCLGLLWWALARSTGREPRPTA